MERRTLLRLGAVGAAGTLAGCPSLPPGGRPTETPTPEGRVFRIGPSSPGCPGDSWGQMAALEDTYDVAVESLDDAREVARRPEEPKFDRAYRHVEPRPDAIAWRDTTQRVDETYDAEAWYVFVPERPHDEEGVLVVARANASTVAVRFFVGAC